MHSDVAVKIGESFVLGLSNMKDEHIFYLVVGLWFLFGIGITVWGVRMIRKEKRE